MKFFKKSEPESVTEQELELKDGKTEDQETATATETMNEEVIAQDKLEQKPAVGSKNFFKIPFLGGNQAQPPQVPSKDEDKAPEVPAKEERSSFSLLNFMKSAPAPVQEKIDEVPEPNAEKPSKFWTFSRKSNKVQTPNDAAGTNQKVIDETMPNALERTCKNSEPNPAENVKAFSFKIPSFVSKAEELVPDAKEGSEAGEVLNDTEQDRATQSFTLFRKKDGTSFFNLFKSETETLKTEGAVENTPPTPEPVAPDNEQTSVEKPARKSFTLFRKKVGPKKDNGPEIESKEIEVDNRDAVQSFTLFRKKDGTKRFSLFKQGKSVQTQTGDDLDSAEDVARAAETS